MDLSTIPRALAGGALIGLAASLALLLHGRIAGISGTLGRALAGDDGGSFRLAFLAGLVGTGALAARFAPSAIGAPLRGVAGLAVAGVLVGVGTTLANGCTSGHGVCGLSNFSPRSVTATAAFFGVAAVTVFVVRHLLA